MGRAYYISIIPLLLTIIGIEGCYSNGNSSSSTKVTPKREKSVVRVSGDSIMLTKSSVSSAYLTFDLGCGISRTCSFDVNQKKSFMDILKTGTRDVYNLALLLANNNGQIPVRITSQSLLDTTVLVNVIPKGGSSYYATITRGPAASLINDVSLSNTEGEVTRWLFRNNMGNVGSEKITQIAEYIQDLRRTGLERYTTTSKIPTVKQVEKSYQLNSNLKADNYYVLAANSEDKFKPFVEEMVSKKFNGAVHSLNQPVHCYYFEGIKGTTCLFLVGIDNDWSYQIIPAGLVCVDNQAPDYMYPSTTNLMGSSIELKTLNSIVDIPEDKPVYMGYAYLRTTDFGGNGVSCNVNFDVTYGGDISSLTVVRDGNLTKWLGKGNKVVDLTDGKGNKKFSYELHLEDGDNYVTIILKDKIGNTTEFQMNVPAHFTWHESNDINNNISIWN